MRVYLPSTVRLLRAALDQDTIAAPGGYVFAVTEGFRAEYPGSDEEELEYLALSDAARASLRLLAADTDTDQLRVVLAADVDDATPAPELDRAVARIGAPVPWRKVASVHIDGADAAEVVEAAAAAVDAADLGDLDAEFAVGEAGEVDLAWYAPSEIRFLLQDMA